MENCSSTAGDTTLNQNKTVVQGGKDITDIVQSKYGCNHKKVVIFDEPDLELFVCVAVHSVHLGPSLGGLRYVPYRESSDAIFDAIGLSKGMTSKAALAGLPLGGGKATVIEKRKLSTEHRKEFMLEVGKRIASLQGLYITAEDSGTFPADMLEIEKVCKWVVGLPGRSGDPSVLTAKGVFYGIRACVQAHPKLLGRDIDGLTVAIQGVGNVGFVLAKMLHEAGAKLIVSDFDQSRIDTLRDSIGEKRVHYLGPQEDSALIYSIDCDVFAPCALSSVINSKSIDQLGAKIIAGAANLQLAEKGFDQLLFDRGILWAVDYVINAGGLINASTEVIDDGSYDADKVNEKVEAIGDTLSTIFDRSKYEQRPPGCIADRMVSEILQASTPSHKFLSK